MSHKKLRINKHCLNCGQEVEERYCSHCGQENLELDDSAILLLVHYIKDLFHYDGKLWHSLKNLVTRPGLVAREYMEGKRQRHLDPIRFYVFASTVFFLTFFFVVGKDVVKSSLSPSTNYSKRLYHLHQEKEFLHGSPDTTYINHLITSLEMASTDTISPTGDTISNDLDITLFDAERDTAVNMGWLEKVLAERFEAKASELEEKHAGDDEEALSAFLDELIHTLPQLFFLSLPFFAFLLMILYWRSGKSTYVEHFIFSIYFYAYLFSILLVYILIGWLMGKMLGSGLETIKNWIIFLMTLYPLIYLFLSMKRFYQDRLRRLAIRFMVLMFFLAIIILALFLLIAVVTFLV